MKQVAVAILNWNGIRFLKEFLPGVVEHSSIVADIYIIDNASTDESLEFVRTHFPQVKLVLLDKNYGFAGGYNRGLLHIPNEWFVLLNSDVEVTPHWIEPVMDYLAQEKDMVACQPKILDYHRREYFEYAGAAGGYIDKDGFAFCAGRIFYAFDKNDDQQYSENEEVFWASGAAMFIKKSAYEEVGGLDEDFFAHMEEIDLCWRLKNRGYRVGACRKSEVYHYGGGTLDRMNPYKTFLNFRNNLFMLLKNYRAGNTGLKIFRRMLLDGVAGIRFLLEGNFSYFIAVLKAHFHFYASFFKMMKKRKFEKANDRSVNLKGMYNASIIKAFFLHKKHFYRDLDKHSFVK